jgi:hypothetical protein
VLVTACVVPSSPILVTLMKEASGSSKTSVLTRATRHNIPEDTILHSHRRENLKSYILNNAIKDITTTPESRTEWRFLTSDTVNESYVKLKNKHVISKLINLE